VNKAILIFGAAKLQRSLIKQAKNLGLLTIAVDPDPNAECRKLVDKFEIVDGNDFNRTLAIAKRYEISGIITTATDKPLVMMARIAENLELPFYSVKTAIISTDKSLMKDAFQLADIPCAKGRLASNLDKIGDLKFPVIVKPRDNSGSRGVVYCNNEQELQGAFMEALRFTKKDTVLVEEFIEGKEYSIESLHFGDETKIIQYTEKITSALPYNVEMGHNQPADILGHDKNNIKIIIENIAKELGFENCASHTEIKINSRGVFVIETSPRLGGDFITSDLVPLSTGINMERSLIEIALGSAPYFPIEFNKAAIVRYIKLNFDFIESICLPENPKEVWGADHFTFKLQPGDIIPKIKNSLDRYGEVIFSGDSIPSLLDKYKFFLEKFENNINVK